MVHWLCISFQNRMVYANFQGTQKDFKQAARWIKGYESKHLEVKKITEELWKYAERL